MEETLRMHGRAVVLRRTAASRLPYHQPTELSPPDETVARPISRLVRPHLQVQRQVQRLLRALVHSQRYALCIEIARTSGRGHLVQTRGRRIGGFYLRRLLFGGGGRGSPKTPRTPSTPSTPRKHREHQGQQGQQGQREQRENQEHQEHQDNKNIKNIKTIKNNDTAQRAFRTWPTVRRLRTSAGL